MLYYGEVPHADFHNDTAKNTTNSLVDSTFLSNSLLTMLLKLVQNGCFSATIDC